MGYELSNVKRNLGELTKMLKNPPPWGNTPEFRALSAALTELWDQSERMYAPDERGEPPGLDEGALDSLNKVYDKALDALRDFDAAPSGGSREEEYARERFRRLRPMLLDDRRVLAQVDPEKGVTLPQAMANAVTVVADVGEGKTHFAGNVKLRLVPVQLQSPDGVTEEGYFQQVAPPDADRRAAELYDRLGEKYPQFGELLDELARIPPAELIHSSMRSTDTSFIRPIRADMSETPYLAMVKDDGGQDAKAYLQEKLRKYLLMPLLGLPSETKDMAPEKAERYKKADEMVARMEQQDGYMDFAHELFGEMDEIYEELNFYDRNPFQLPKGEELSGRNIATKQVASLLGCSHVAPDARPMVMIQNGVETRGTFVAKQDGVSLDSLTPDHPLVRQIKLDEGDNRTDKTLSDFFTPQALRDVSDIQVLMYITGSARVQADNVVLKLKEQDDGKLMVSGVSLKNNAMSFAATDVDAKTDSYAPDENRLLIVSDDMAKRINGMTKEKLDRALSGFGLSGRETEIAWQRVGRLKDRLKQDEGIFDLTRPNEKREEIQRALEQRAKISLQFKEINANKDLAKNERDAQITKLRAENVALSKITGNFTGFGPTDLASGHIRVLKDDEWSRFNLKELKKAEGNAMFGELYGYGDGFRQTFGDQRTIQSENNRIENLFRKAKGEPVGEIILSEENKKLLIKQKTEDAALKFREEDLKTNDVPPPTDSRPVAASVQGNGNRHDPDPLGVNKDADTVRLFVPQGEELTAVGGNLNRRYPLSYTEDGAEKKAFFTEAVNVSYRQGYERAFDEVMEKNPRYADVLAQIRNHFRSNARDYGEEDMMQSASYVPEYEMARLPFQEIGIGKERADALRKDKEFDALWDDLIVNRLSKSNTVYAGSLMQNVEPGATIDKRNVAMYKVAQALDSGVIAKCTTAQASRGDRIVDGVLMEAVEGVNRHSLKSAGLAALTEEQRNQAMSDPRGLQSLAELQVMDYLCLNLDRHQDNLFYQFEGLGTDSPKLVGVKGIDNDYSFRAMSVAANDSPSQHLTALDNITVIPKALSEKLQDPRTMDKMRGDLKACGLSDGEIEKTAERVQMLNNAVKEGKIEAVESWEGKTLDSLARNGGEKKVNNIFCRAHDAMVKMKDAILEQEAEEPIHFARAQKVDAFGASIVQSDERLRAKKAAELSLLDRVGKLVGKTPVKSGADSYIETFRDVAQQSREMLGAIRQADPALLWSSKQFRAMRRACTELARQSEQMFKVADANPKLGFRKEKIEQLYESMKRVSDCAREYTTFKANQCMSDNRQPNARERARMAVAVKMQGMSAGLARSTARSLDASIVRAAGAGALDNIIERERAKLPNVPDRKLETRLSELIYLKSVSRFAATGGAKNEQLGGMVTERELDEGARKVRESGAFRNLCASKGAAGLRVLAETDGAAGLFDSYLESGRAIAPNAKQAGA